MKLSVSLPDEDVEFLDHYSRTRGYDSRSAVVHKAVRLLRAAELGEAYAQAWDDWAASGEADAWEAALDDSLEGTDAAR